MANAQDVGQRISQVPSLDRRRKILSIGATLTLCGLPGSDCLEVISITICATAKRSENSIKCNQDVCPLNILDLRLDTFQIV
jgi:hypothetical protein